MDRVSVISTGRAVPNSTNTCSLEYFVCDLEISELLKLLLGLQPTADKIRQSTCGL